MMPRHHKTWLSDTEEDTIDRCDIDGTPTWRDLNTEDLNMGGPQHEGIPTWRDPNTGDLNMGGPQHGGRDLNMGYFSMEGPQHRGTPTRRDPNTEGSQHGKTPTWRYLP